MAPQMDLFSVAMDGIACQVNIMFYYVILLYFIRVIEAPDF